MLKQSVSEELSGGYSRWRMLQSLTTGLSTPTTPERSDVPLFRRTGLIFTITIVAASRYPCNTTPHRLPMGAVGLFYILGSHMFHIEWAWLWYTLWNTSITARKQQRLCEMNSIYNGACVIYLVYDLLMHPGRSTVTHFTALGRSSIQCISGGPKICNVMSLRPAAWLGGVLTLRLRSQSSLDIVWC